MNRMLPLLLLVCASLLAGMMTDARAETHRSTRLGNPATRFAPPLKTSDDLRRTLLSEALREDVLKVLRLSEFNGDFEDFRRAVANAPIREISIPVGSVLSAMSTRRNGEPRLLRNVLWAGKKPIDAYEFSFISGERRYRIVTPKACSNFWAEEQLPRPVAALSLACEAPAESGQPNLITVCNTLSNSGELTEPLAMLSLPMPVGAKVRCVSGGANVSDSTQLTWTYADFAPGEQRKVCATFVPERTGEVLFRSGAAGTRAASVTSQCATRVTDTAAALLEVSDQTDPVKVGGEVVYRIKVSNPNTQTLTQARIVARPGTGQRLIDGGGATPITLAEDGRLVADALAAMKPGETAEWLITVRAEQAGEARFGVTLETDQFFCPVEATEVTTQD